MTNAVVVVLGIVQGQLASTSAFGPLAFAALMIINATFFHVLPFIRTRGRFSPGLATAVALLYPIGGTVFYQARIEGRLSLAVALVAFAAGAVLMAFPINLLNLKSKAYFRQT